MTLLRRYGLSGISSPPPLPIVQIQAGQILGQSNFGVCGYVNTRYTIFDVEIDDLGRDQYITHNFVWRRVNGWAIWRRASDGQLVWWEADTFNTPGTQRDTGLFLPNRRISGWVLNNGYSGDSNNSTMSATVHIDGVGEYTGVSFYQTRFSGNYDWATYFDENNSNTSYVPLGVLNFIGKVYNYEVNSASDGSGTKYYKWNWNAGSGNIIPKDPTASCGSNLTIVAGSSTLVWV